MSASGYLALSNQISVKLTDSKSESQFSASDHVACKKFKTMMTGGYENARFMEDWKHHLGCFGSCISPATNASGWARQISLDVSLTFSSPQSSKLEPCATLSGGGDIRRKDLLLQLLLYSWIGLHLCVQSSSQNMPCVNPCVQCTIYWQIPLFQQLLLSIEMSQLNSSMGSSLSL